MSQNFWEWLAPDQGNMAHLVLVNDYGQGGVACGAWSTTRPELYVAMPDVRRCRRCQEVTR